MILLGSAQKEMEVLIGNKVIEIFLPNLLISNYLITLSFCQTIPI